MYYRWVYFGSRASWSLFDVPRAAASTLFLGCRISRGAGAQDDPLDFGMHACCFLCGELAQGVLPMPRGARPLSLFFSQCPAPRFGGGCIVACLGSWVRRARAVFVLCNISLLSGILKQTVCARVLLQLWPPRLEYGDSWYSVCSTCDRGSAGSVVVPFVVLFAAFQFFGLACASVTRC